MDFHAWYTSVFHETHPTSPNRSQSQKYSSKHLTTFDKPIMPQWRLPSPLWLWYSCQPNSEDQAWHTLPSKWIPCPAARDSERKCASLGRQMDFNGNSIWKQHVYPTWSVSMASIEDILLAKIPYNWSGKTLDDSSLSRLWLRTNQIIPHLFCRGYGFFWASLGCKSGSDSEGLVDEARPSRSDFLPLSPYCLPRPNQETKS